MTSMASPKDDDRPDDNPTTVASRAELAAAPVNGAVDAQPLARCAAESQKCLREQENLAKGVAMTISTRFACTYNSA